MFKKATIQNIKIRLAISGPSGSGKTYSSLAIASHLGKSVAVIDTEHGSASRYANLFSFDVCELDSFHPAKYIEAIREAESAGYEVIIIDSLSHAWWAELEIVDNNKNKFNAWGPARELERKLVKAMVASKAHIIATMRSKTEWDLDAIDPKTGKKTIARIGTAPVQSSGIEYEFDLFGEISLQHILTLSKSRCADLQDKSFLNPGRELAESLLRWVQSAPIVEIQPDAEPDISQWKTSGDAVRWAQSLITDISPKDLENQFKSIEGTGLEKAQKWVETVKELASF